MPVKNIPLDSIIPEPWVRNNLIYLTRAGSHIYGTATEDSDLDIRGVCFPKKEHILGLETFEQYISPSGDCTIYSLKKFVQLALASNPSILELLYTNAADISMIKDVGEELRQLAPRFLSKRVYKTFGGYARQQLHKVQHGPSRENSKRKEIIDRHGYDTKAASHLIRLLYMGAELLQDKNISLPCAIKDQLIAIKNGKTGLDEVLALSNQMFQELEYQYRISSLPDQPNTKRVEEWLIITLAKNCLRQEN